MTKTVTYPVVNVGEFLSIAKKQILDDMKDISREEYLDILINNGFPKFDVDHLKDFIKKQPSLINLPPMLVDIGDNLCYWFVSGTDAMVVYKPHFNDKPTIDTYEKFFGDIEDITII